ncbi:MAG TPA: metallophosphoesterase [Ktedonobacterales bacterium]|nr:metallophosphoesterase [Ktedonobacterales bacterium]
MPRVVVTSDLHLGITSAGRIQAMVERIQAEQPALTVLAGDIGEPFEQFVACLELFRGLPGEVAVLAGNHDMWSVDGRHHSQDLLERLLPQATRDAGMLWLEDAVWQREGLVVAGSMAWYDYTAADPDLPPHDEAYWLQLKQRFHPDARYIDWPWSDPEVAARLGDGLRARVAAAAADPAVWGIAVVTHVPIFERQMLRKPGDLRWGSTNAYFGNLTLGQRLRDVVKLRYVLSGHTHVGREGQVERPPLAPLPVVVVPSDYGKPAYVAVDLAP